MALVGSAVVRCSKQAAQGVQHHLCGHAHYPVIMPALQEAMVLPTTATPQCPICSYLTFMSTPAQPCLVVLKAAAHHVTQTLSGRRWVQGIAQNI